jgi:hypothetical protein
MAPYRSDESKSAERRRGRRFSLQVRAGVSGGGKTHWGSLSNVSRTGVAMSLKQQLRPNQRVTLLFNLRSADGREVTESLAAKLIWQLGGKAGFELEPPLKGRSAAVLKAPYLSAYLIEKEGGG